MKKIEAIETYKCEDCDCEWGIDYATFEKPACPNCGEYLNVVETTK